MRVVDDKDLVAAVQAGDPAPYGELYERYEAKLYNYAYRIAGDREDARDIAQEAFVKVFEALPALADRDVEIGRYLYRTAHNLAIDTVRGRSRVTSPEPLEFEHEDSVYADPERAALLKEQQAKVLAATVGLSDQHRAVLALRELNGLSYQDIGDVLDMPRTTVGVTLMRARLKLKGAVRMSYVDVDKLAEECRDMLPLLSAMIDGELSAEERERVERHLEDCPLCRLALEEMTEASESYRGLIPLLPPFGLRPDVLGRFVPHAGTTPQTAQVPAKGLGARLAGLPGPAKAALLAGVVALSVVAGAGIGVAVLPRGGVRTASSAGGGAAVTSTGPASASTAAPAARPKTNAPGSETRLADTQPPPAPELLSPANDASVSDADPVVTLRWSSVKDPSGVTYVVQVQTFLGGGAGWGEVRRVGGLDATSYRLTVENPHERWRVWAVDGQGNAGGTSEWRTVTRLAPDTGSSGGSQQPTYTPGPPPYFVAPTSPPTIY